MKFSIRSKFSAGMVSLSIILVLSLFSAYFMNRLSNKNVAILKENYLSIVYAREMSVGLTKINQEISKSFILNRNCDKLILKSQLDSVAKSLQSEKNNITEPGEGKLVNSIEKELKEYSDSVAKFVESPRLAAGILYLQGKFETLNDQLILLSQMNGNAIELKAGESKISSQDAMTQMAILATLCFIVALFYSYSFSSYSNERFTQLYNGIIELGAGKYDKRLYFEGADKFYEISLIINEMAEKLNENKSKLAVTLPNESGKALIGSDLQELKNMLIRIRIIEADAEALLAGFEPKN